MTRSRLFPCDATPIAHHGGAFAPPSGSRPMTPLSRREFLAATAAVAATGTSTAAPTKSDEVAKFKLGLVTYNVPKDWDLPTILKVCKEVGIAAVECRTTHKHKVERNLTTE